MSGGGPRDNQKTTKSRIAKLERVEVKMTSRLCLGFFVSALFSRLLVFLLILAEDISRVNKMLFFVRTAAEPVV